MSKYMVLLLLILSYPIITGYFPSNWSAEHAKDDASQSSAVVIGRVVGIELSEDSRISEKDANNAVMISKLRVYSARIRIAKSYKGDLGVGDEVLIPIGCDFISPYDASKDDLTPSEATLSLAGTQQGYDLRINQLYLLFLSRSKDGWDLRSGPCSSAWLHPRNQMQFGSPGQKWGNQLETDKYLRELVDQLK